MTEDSHIACVGEAGPQQREAQDDERHQQLLRGSGQWQGWTKSACLLRQRGTTGMMNLTLPLLAQLPCLLEIRRVNPARAVGLRGRYGRMCAILPPSVLLLPLLRCTHLEDQVVLEVPILVHALWLHAVRLKSQYTGKVHEIGDSAGPVDVEAVDQR